MSDGARRYLALTLGARPMLVALDDVREVLRVPPITEVPRCPRGVRGVAMVHGAVVTVIDLALAFDGRATEVDEGARLVMVPAEDGERVAILASAVGRILALEPARFAAPEVSAGAWLAVVDGVAAEGDAEPALRLDRARALAAALR